MAMRPAERAALAARMREEVRATSWELTAARMNKLIAKELKKAGTGVRRVLKDRPATAHPESALMMSNLKP